MFRGCHASSLSRSDCFPSLFFFWNGSPLQLSGSQKSESSLLPNTCWNEREQMLLLVVCVCLGRCALHLQGKTGHILYILFFLIFFSTNVSVLIGSLSYKGFRFLASASRSQKIATLKYIHLSKNKPMNKCLKYLWPKFLWKSMKMLEPKPGSFLSPRLFAAVVSH